MNRATQALLSAVLLAAFAWAQDTPQTPPTPPAPVKPETPTTPETPATPATPRTPRTPRPPKPPRPPRPERGSYLGIDTRDVTPERAGALKLQSAQGVEVAMVDQDAPAGKAGLKEHDVITKFNSQSVADPFELRRLIRGTTPGETVTLGIVRDGRPMDVKVKLAGRPEWGGTILHIPPIKIPPIPDIDVPVVVMSTRKGGLTVEPITRQLADAFGVKDGHGIMVRSVEKNSRAEAAGFRAGDIIVRVGSEVIDSVNDWNQAVRQNAGGKTTVTVVREKREQTLTLAVPEKPSEGSALSFPETNVDLGEMQEQIAQIGPEVQKAVADAQKEWAKAWNSQEFQKQMREAQRAARDTMRMNRAELEKQMEQVRRETEKARKEWEKSREEWQKEQQNDQQ